MTLEIDVLTLFPTMVAGPLAESIPGRIQERGLVTVRSSNAVAQGVPADWRERFVAAFDTEFQEWIDTLAAGAPPTGPSSWDGYAAAAVCDAGVEALRDGARVPITLAHKPALYA